MLKTGFKSFIYSFCISLFAIISANKLFFCEKNTYPSDLNIQNKSIALYLADTNPSYVPVKKIALNSLPTIQKQQIADTPPETEPEIIVASNLELLDIPLEFVENTTNNGEASLYEQKIALADVLYAPDKPLPMPEIKAEPVYKPEETIEIKIASAPIYTPQEKPVKEIIPNSNELKIEENQPSQKNNDLIIARNEAVGDIPLMQTKNYSGVNQVQLGNPKDLQHVALADANMPIQSMSSDEKNQNTTATQKNQLKDSPWVIAKSSGSKNLLMDASFTAKSEKEFKDLIPLQNNNNVLLASETAKNLIIPIPENIMNQKDITPQLAYPETSEDKQKEIDINEKIKENEKNKKLLENKKEAETKEILTPVEENIDITKNTPVVDNKEMLKLSNEQLKENDSDKSKDSLMNALSSFFTKTAKTTSDVKSSILKKAETTKKAKDKKRAKSRPTTILPTEIRLSFQPNRAEISGQTLRWIQAFATKTAQTPNLALEIRMDGTSSTNLQQKRLNLLYNILTNKGVDYSMINTVFTNRDPNSFILRTISLKNNNNKGVNNQKTNRYIQW